MRRLIGLLAAFLFSGAPMNALAQIVPGSAPADEYFGAHHESILGIRNRLDRIDTRADQDMVSGPSMNELNDLQGALLDWQHQYPGDPWLPHMFTRLLNDYQRVGAESSPQAQAAFNAMQQAYPDSEETSRVIAMGYGNAITPGESAQAPMQAQAQVFEPSASIPNNVWVRFDQTRGSVNPPPPPQQ